MIAFSSRAQSLHYNQDVTYLHEYYVDPSTGSDTNDGSYQQPFKSLTHAMDVAVPRDLIVLRTGIYLEDHDILHCNSPDFDCNLGIPENFPIYWRNDVTIQAYLSSLDPLVFEEAVLSTEQNCNQDLLRPSHKDFVTQDHWKQYHGKWMADSDPRFSQVIGVKFFTNAQGDPTHGGG